MVSAVRDRSMGLLWVYTVEWAKLVYFPGEKHDFLENTWYLRFFSYNHDFRYLFAAINRHTMKLRLQTSWDP